MRFLGPDGREWVSILVANNRPFAVACLAAWSELEEGRGSAWLLQAKAITVPAEVLPWARARLEGGDDAREV